MKGLAILEGQARLWDEYGHTSCTHGSKPRTWLMEVDKHPVSIYRILVMYCYVILTHRTQPQEHKWHTFPHYETYLYGKINIIAVYYYFCFMMKTNFFVFFFFINGMKFSLSKNQSGSPSKKHDEQKWLTFFLLVADLYSCTKWKGHNFKKTAWGGYR